MKALLLVLLLVPFSANAQSGLELKYDRFKGVTSARVPYDYVRISTTEIRFAQITALFTFKGETLRDPQKDFSVGFQVVSENWVYAGNQRPSWIILADGKKIWDGEGERIGSNTFSGLVSETIAVTLERSIMEQIVKAKSVEMQIGTIEIQFTTANAKAFRSLFEASTPPKT